MPLGSLQHKEQRQKSCKKYGEQDIAICMFFFRLCCLVVPRGLLDAPGKQVPNYPELGVFCSLVPLRITRLALELGEQPGRSWGKSLERLALPPH